jgi:inner membrane protein
MDSLTQIALGAAVGEAVLGRRIGPRAMLWGALCGTLPDLDVLVPLGGVVEDFTYHRSWSHSLLVMAAFTPMMVWLILKVHPQTRELRWRWHGLVYLAFATHALLDSFTVYGTQIFWPLPRPPESWSTVFIIDPAYTVPLLLGVIAAWIFNRRRASWATGANAVGLALSTLYLGWTVGAKWHVEDQVRASLARQGVQYERLLTTPAPFNTLLWRVVAVDSAAYYEGFYSIVADEGDVALARYPSATALLDPLETSWPVQRLRWFTRGFYAVSQLGESVVMTDLRMGVEPDYIFRFVVGEIGNPHPRPVTPRAVSATPRFDRLGWVWRRIWDAGAARDPVS